MNYKGLITEELVSFCTIKIEKVHILKMHNAHVLACKCIFKCTLFRTLGKSSDGNAFRIFITAHEGTTFFLFRQDVSQIQRLCPQYIYII